MLKPDTELAESWAKIPADLQYEGHDIKICLVKEGRLNVCYAVVIATNKTLKTREKDKVVFRSHSANAAVRMMLSFLKLD